MLITAEFLYAGLPDYWGGNSDRWDNDKGCLFAYYGPSTTVRDIIDGAIDDFMSGGDCDSLPDNVDGVMIREALLDHLSEDGITDYHSGAISELALEYADVNKLDRCRGCDARVGEMHDEDCEALAELLGDTVYDADDVCVTLDDCNEDECCDSPIIVFLIRAEVCDECGKLAEHVVDELCAACAVKYGYVDKVWFSINYKCPCGAKWNMENDCTCNDRCPECNKEIEPSDWEDCSADCTWDEQTKA